MDPTWSTLPRHTRHGTFVMRKVHPSRKPSSSLLHKVRRGTVECLPWLPSLWGTHTLADWATDGAVDSTTSRASQPPLSTPHLDACTLHTLTLTPRSLTRSQISDSHAFPLRFESLGWPEAVEPWEAVAQPSADEGISHRIPLSHTRQGAP
jgi:hypothetical protein